MAGLLAVFLLGAPLAGLAAAHWSYAAGLRVEHAQEFAWHQIPAVLLAMPRLRATTAMSRRCMPGGPLATERSTAATFPPGRCPQPAAPCWCGRTHPAG